MRYYYLGTLGYYVSKTFEDVFMREKRNDFVEMMLHHVLTIELYVGSYITNYMGIGSLIILTLDCTQICIALSRSFSETKFKSLSITFGVGMWLTWMYFRVFIYPFIYYQGLWTLPRGIPGFFQKLDEKFVSDCLFWLCSGMHVLNIWWAFLITKILLKARKGSDSDIVNKVE